MKFKRVFGIVLSVFVITLTVVGLHPNATIEFYHINDSYASFSPLWFEEYKEKKV